MKMKKQSRRRCAINLGRWVSYAAAGTVTALAASNDAEAAILYSGPINFTITNPTPGSVQVNNTKTFNELSANSHPDAKKLFRIRGEAMPPGPGAPGHPSVSAFFDLAQIFNNGPANAAQGAFVGYSHSGHRYASKLALGANLSGGPFFGTGLLDYLVKQPGGYNQVPGGQWQPAGTGFLQFRFNDGAGFQYGWARLTMSGPRHENVTIVDYAYGTVGQAITAGQTAVTPEPATLGLLAMGALRLLAVRRAARNSRSIE